MSARAVHLVALVTLAGCQVTPGDYRGRACDDDHPCFDGRECVDNVCAMTSGLPGVDPSGCVLWRQQSEGFDELQSCPGCSAAVNPSNGNALTAIISGPSAPNDFAWGRAELADGPSAEQGQLRGIIDPTSTSDMKARSPVVQLESNGAKVLEVYYRDNWELGLASAAGTLSPTAIDVINDSARFSEGQPHRFELRWKRGLLIQLTVDDQLVLTRSLSASTGAAPALSAVKVGILGYSADLSESGWAGTFREWALCDDLEATFE